MSDLHERAAKALGWGLTLEGPSYGLVCPACGVRVAGPFESAHDIPDYAPHESVPKQW
jgi:hypothetical protein